MASGGFSFLSSSSSSPGRGDRGVAAADVEALISEAADLVALEQIAKLNTAHVSDALLPTDLESRFLKLKSFPATTTTRQPPRRLNSAPAPPCQEPTPTDEAEIPISTSPAIPSDEKKGPDPARSGGEKKGSDPARSSGEKKGSGRKSSTISRGSSSEEEDKSDSSPPRRQQRCCFGFSPGGKRRRVSSRKSAIRGLDDELLSELAAVSMKEQRRRMRKAVREEEEKLSCEAEKLVELVKEASARMELPAIGGLPSDSDDDDEKFK